MSSFTHRWTELVNAPTAHAEPVPTPPPPLDSRQLTLVSAHQTPRLPVNAPVAFPGYEILGELGRGGMGVVYKARQRNLNRLVALKVVLAGPLASDEDKARFRIEAEAAALLHHPNIVQVYEVGECAGFSFMALELVEGATLRQWQNGTPVEPQHAARLVSTVARAIHHAHEHGIVHRDLKPANILLGGERSGTASNGGSGPRPVEPAALRLNNAQPKITDFGLAKSLSGGADLTGTGVACGTPNYMAPEQIRGRPPGPGVDVYGLGALLFELLAGRTPFIGSDAATVMNQITRDEAPNVRTLAPKAPRDLGVIVAKCLEKDPARRYSTARALADDLDRFMNGKPIAARPVGAAERLWRWTRRNPVAAGFLLAATVGCALTGALALELLHSRNDERAARAGADAARGEAEHASAELARALALAQDARQAAERERARAQAARETAIEQRKQADSARLKSESDLRIAGNVIRDAIRELARDPKFAGNELRGTRVMLLKTGRAFRDSVLAGNSNTREWLEMLCDVSHWLGYLEYRNDNHLSAAKEYQDAADAAARWAELEPANTLPRARRADSLMGAGSALSNAGRLDESERVYRAAAELIEVVVAERAKARDALELPDRHRARDIYERLAVVLGRRGKFGDRERAAWRALEHARALAAAGRDAPELLRVVQRAHQGYAVALGALGRGDEGECHFDAALELTNRHLATGPKGTPYTPDRVLVLLALADFQHVQNQHERADQTFRDAIGELERAAAALPAGSVHAQLGIDVAAACSRHAAFLRARGRWGDAEKRYNQALDALVPVLRQSPGLFPALEAAAIAREGRAHVYNAANRHREAAGEWARLAAEDPRPVSRSHHELFVLQSLLYAGDWRIAYNGALGLMRKPMPGWMQVDLARVWCLISKQAATDGAVSPEERALATKEATEHAVRCLEGAREAGEFENPLRVQWFASRAEDFVPVHDRFDPKKK